MRIYALFIFLLSATAGYAQGNINNYKYVIVPTQFDFSKEENQYGLNMLSKQLLAEKGFTAFLSNEALPPEVAGNKCNALQAEVVQKKNLFVTNLTLQLKDCQGNIIFKGKEGKSREKEYRAAYNLALRDAFTSLNETPYKYDGTAIAPAQQPAPATTAPVAPAATTATPSPAPATPAAADAAGTLYAQATATGYQLIDTTPKKVLTLLKTSMQDYFIAEDGASTGVVFKKNGEWLFEYYSGNQLVSRKLQIKF